MQEDVDMSEEVEPELSIHENNVVKEKIKTHMKKLFAANEEKRVRLVYVVSDDLLLNTSLYLSIIRMEWQKNH